MDSSARSMTRNGVRRDTGWSEGDFLKDRAICSCLNAHVMEPTEREDTGERMKQGDWRGKRR